MERLLLIILLNLAYYFKALRFGYVSDDLQTADYNFKGSLWQRIKFSISGKKWTDPQSEHFISLIVHTINCSLIYWVFGANQASFFAALLFSVNPITLFGSCWISGRGYAISLMLGLLFYKFGVWGIPFYLSGVFFGFTLAPLPLVFLNPLSLVILVYILLFFRGNNLKSVKRRASLINNENKKISVRKLILAVKTYAYYFLHCLFPRRIGMYHTFLFTYGLLESDIKHWVRLDKWFWGGLVLASSAIYILITDFYGLRFPLLWFSCCIGLWLNIYMINQTIADRQAYVACAGLMLLLGKLISPTVFFIIFTYYITRNWLHINAFINDSLLLDYNIYDINYPDQIFVWTLKGDKERALLRPFMALESWAKGLSYRPQDTRLHFFIAKTLAEMGFCKEAKSHLDEMERNPFTSDVPNGITCAIPALKEFIRKRQDDKAKLH